MTTLANAVANHVKENNISIYKNSVVKYSELAFQLALSRCSGMKFNGVSVEQFASDKLLTLCFLEDVSHNHDSSFNDMVYIITVIANYNEE